MSSLYNSSIKKQQSPTVNQQQQNQDQSNYMSEQENVDKVDVDYITDNQYLVYKNKVVWKEIYQNQVPVVIVSKDKGSFTSVINLNIFKRVNYQNKGLEIKIQLSDDSNHLFLFLAEIDNKKFLEMKKSQQISCDLQSLPDKIDQLIQLAYESSSDQFEFEIKLEIGQNNYSNKLSINEINNFKTIPHLQIDISEADDETIKLYLAYKLSLEMQKNEDLRIINQKQIFQLESNQDQSDDVIKQLKQDLTQKSHEIDKLTQQLEDLNNQITKNKEEMETKNIQSLQEQKDKFDEKVNDQQAQINDLQSQQQIQLNINEELKTENQKLNDHISDLKNQIDELQKQKQDIQQNNAELETIRNEQLSTLKDISHQQENLQSQLKEKQEQIQEKNIEIKNLNKQKDELDTELKKQLKQNGDSEKNLKEFQVKYEELQKSQKELQQKIIKKNTKTGNMKNQIKTLESEIEELNRQNKNQDIQLQLKSAQEELLNELKEENQNLKQKLKESKKLIKENQNILQSIEKKSTKMQSTHKKNLSQTLYSGENKQHNNTNNEFYNQDKKDFSQSIQRKIQNLSLYNPLQSSDYQDLMYQQSYKQYNRYEPKNQKKYGSDYKFIDADIVINQTIRQYGKQDSYIQSVDKNDCEQKIRFKRPEKAQ